MWIEDTTLNVHVECTTSRQEMKSKLVLELFDAPRYQVLDYELNEVSLSYLWLIHIEDGIISLLVSGMLDD